MARNPNKTADTFRTKLSILVEHVHADQWHEVFRLANSFANLGDHAEPIRRAWNAINRPAFYRELGYDIEDTIEAGKTAIRERYAEVL